jgi:hypothetical protein
MLLDRGEIINALFRETDRAQRMKTPLALIQIAIDDCSDGCSQSASEIVERMTQLLRSYDLIGALDGGTFLVILPGCNGSGAVMLAERLKSEVSLFQMHPGERPAGLAAYFGIVSSGSRSPMVVIREAELALQRAKTDGPGSIQFSNEATQPGRAASPCSDLPLETLRR